MMTNLARFTLLPVVLFLASHPVSAREPIVPVLGEPIQPVPVDVASDSGKLELGKLLFNDPRLSNDNSLSCASCHQLAAGGDDNVAIGIAAAGGAHIINTPTVFNARFNFRQLWDGSAATLEQQIEHALYSPLEADSSWEELLAKLRADSTVVGKFITIYPDGLTRANYLDALTTFVESLTTPNARFDHYLQGDPAAMTEREKRGYARFKELGCITCHQGVNIGGNLFQKFGIFHDYLAARGGLTRADFGRYNVTGRESDRYVFKVPSLRNIAVTGPYLHDGSAATLEEAIATMGKTQIGTVISDEDIALLVQFLKTLTGEYNGRSLAVDNDFPDNVIPLPSDSEPTLQQVDREES